MARTKRIKHPGLIYHVINRGNNRQAIFLEDEDFEKYLGLIYRYKSKFDFRLFAYCLMTNHVHLLIQVGEEGSISQIMQAITNAHTRHYHFKYRSSGHVWQGRFKSPIVSDDGYLLMVMQYIEQNPVRAGLSQRIEDYRWSSYLLNMRIKESKLIDRAHNPAYQMLGTSTDERVRAYRQHMQLNLQEKDIENIRQSVKQGEGYMSERFRKQMSQMLPKKRSRGRPRKELLDNLLV